jgi:hypothetical protein
MWVEDDTGRNRWPLWAFRCCPGAAYPSARIKASRGVGAHAACGVGSAIVETVGMGGRCGRSAAVRVLPIHPLASRPAGAWVLMSPVVSALPSLRLSAWVAAGSWAWKMVQAAAGGRWCLSASSGYCLPIRSHQGQQGRSCGSWRLLADSPASSMGVGAACGVRSAIVEAVGMVAAGFVGVEDDTGRNRWPLVLYKDFPAAMGRSPL